MLDQNPIQVFSDDDYKALDTSMYQAKHWKKIQEKVKNGPPKIQKKRGRPLGRKNSREDD